MKLQRLPPPVKPTQEDALSKVEESLRVFFEALGVPSEEWTDRGLDINNTPKRVARMYQELLSSYRPGAEADLISKFTQFDEAGDDSMITEGPIHFQSLCAHHMATINGQAFIGYIPKDRIVGASKLARVVEHYSRMLQIQERMGRQIADFLVEHAQPRAVLVSIVAEHYCMKCRGVRQQSSRLVTTTVRPIDVLANQRDVVEEFYRQIQLTKGF